MKVAEVLDRDEAQLLVGLKQVDEILDRRGGDLGLTAETEEALNTSVAAAIGQLEAWFAKALLVG